MKKIVSFFVLGFCSITFYSQQKSNPSYKETIPGTELNFNMVSIPQGKFVMGSPYAQKGRSTDEGPEHEVSIEGFWMSELEITWDLYNLFVSRELDDFMKGKTTGNEVVRDVNAVSGATTPYVEMSFGMGTDGFPAINMTQYAASRFCEWLSALTGNFYRLPTEAEWEYAAKAGTKTAYSFGNNAGSLGDYAWYEGNSEEVYHKAGLKKPNPWGLYDMHGNVAEWTLDQYVAETYNQRKGKAVSNPWVKAKSVYPISVRGGSWEDEPVDLRSNSRSPSMKIWKMRDPQIPKSKWWFTDAPFIGFRIVRPFKTPSPQGQENYWKEKQLD